MTGPWWADSEHGVARPAPAVHGLTQVWTDTGMGRQPWNEQVNRQSRRGAMSADLAASASDVPVERKITVIGFGRRLLAAMLDSVIIFFASMMASTAAGVVGLILGMYSPDAVEISNRFVVATGLLVSVLYYVVSWAKGGGQTIGNFSCLMRIVGTNGQ